MLDRRTFVNIATGALLVTAFPAVAQPEATVYHIGVLSLTEFNKTTLGKVLIEPLAKGGYVLGQNIVFEERSAEGKVEPLPVLAAELVVREEGIAEASAPDSSPLSCQLRRVGHALRPWYLADNCKNSGCRARCANNYQKKPCNDRVI